MSRTSAGVTDPDEISTLIPVTARITIQAGMGAGRVFDGVPLPCVLGRGKQATVQLPDDVQHPTMSRRHVMLSLRGGRLAVQDLSTNGTRVGTKLLPPGDTVTVSDETPVWLGQSTMITAMVQWPDEAASTPARGEAVPLHEAGETEPVPPAMRLSIHTLGSVRVQVDGQDVPHDAWQTRKAVALLTWLALRGTPQDAGRLCDTLWPETEGTTRATLQSTISRIRRALRATVPNCPDPIVLQGSGYGLSPQWRVTCDAGAFEALCGQGERAAAVSLYSGPFLEGYTEEWIELHRVRLQRLYLDALAGLAAAGGTGPDARRWYSRMLACDPCCEAAHVGLMRCMLAAGQRDDAVRQYHDCVRLLKKNLDLPPGPELESLYRGLVG